MDISWLKGDITALDVDAIVTAANANLAGGGGVDGAIHRAAGPELAAACRRLGACPTGEARITPGFNLKARWVIHAVGPIWRGGDENEAALLAGAYAASLALATVHACRSLAFPAISCGIYGYPIPAAMAIGVQAVRAHRPSALARVVFTAFDTEVAAALRQLLGAPISG